MPSQAAGESTEDLGQAVFVGRVCKEGEVHPESEPEVHWLEDAE